MSTERVEQQHGLRCRGADRQNDDGRDGDLCDGPHLHGERERLVVGRVMDDNDRVAVRRCSVRMTATDTHQVRSEGEGGSASACPRKRGQPPKDATDESGV